MTVNVTFLALISFLSAAAACSGVNGQGADNKVQVFSRGSASTGLESKAVGDLEVAMTCRPDQGGRYAETICQNIFDALVLQNATTVEFDVACSEGYDGDDRWVVVTQFARRTRLEPAESHHAAQARAAEILCQFPKSNVLVRPA